MKDKILFVDDDRNVLEACRRQLRKEYEIDIALGGEEGLSKLTPRASYAAIVSDLQMPGMNGIEFLARARKLSPNSVRVMLTGNADLDRAIEAVNEGNVFRFLTKPCAPDSLAKTMAACVEQHRLITAEQELIENTLKGCMKLFTEILSLVSPLAYGRASRARRLCVEVSAALGLEKAWQLEIAAMLSQVGCITVPNEVIKKVSEGRRLELDEKQMYNEHPNIGAKLIAIIPRLEEVADIVKYQQKHFNGKGEPQDGVRGASIPMGARVLHVVLDYDLYLTMRGNPEEALQELNSALGFYDPRVLKTLNSVIAAEVQSAPMSVNLDQLRSGMVLANDIKSIRGVILIAKGQEITSSSRMRLENYAKKMEVQLPILIVQTEKEAEIRRKKTVTPSQPQWEVVR